MTMATAPQKTRLERRGVLLSLTVSLGLAAFAFLAGYASGSATVLLDGYYSLLTALCGVGALRVAVLLRRPDNSHYPFGYAGFEPLLNFVRGCLVLGVTLYASTDAVAVLARGGQAVANLSVALYALLTASACFFVSARVGRLAVAVNSPLLKVDSQSWRVDGMISLAIFLAFVGAGSLTGRIDPMYLALIDPLMVLALSLLTLPVPLRIVRSAVKQLVGAASGCEREAVVLQRVEEVLRESPTLDVVPRITRLGRELYLNIYVVLEEDLRIAELDELRGRISTVCREVEPLSIVDVLFTRQARWAAPETTVR